MSRPTPETDAARHDLSDYGSPVLCSWGDWVHVDVASKLERERDEARESFVIATDQMVIAQGKVREANKELDEARAVADELVAIATRYLGWHLSRTPMGPDDDHLAQSRKITEAIARWKSLANA